MTEPEIIAWHKEAGVIEDGRSAGDWQEGDDILVRFLPDHQPDDGLFAYVEENWYAERVDHPKDPDRVIGYKVTCRTEYKICDDPAMENEVWSDYEYESMGQTYETAKQAQAVARHEAEGSDPSYIVWDGRTKERIR